MDTIVLTGGGTGGHIYPNLALAKEFERRGLAPVYVGGEGDTLERRLATAAGLEYHGLPTVKLIRSLSPSALKNDLAIPAKLARAKRQAVELIERLAPKAVFSKGGFAALPCVLAAAKLGIPVIAHESDLTLGLSNRIAAKKGATVLKANPLARFDGVTVGMPLRQELFLANREVARARLGIFGDRRVILFVGGSSGAQALNAEVERNLIKLTEKYDIIHVVGAKNRLPASRLPHYMPVGYADDIASLYAASDLVASRAGATAVFELSALKKRALFIPLPKGVSRGDQIDNARLAQKFGASVLWQDPSFSDNFLPSVEKALSKAPMTPICDDSNGKIADIVCATMRRGDICNDKKL